MFNNRRYWQDMKLCCCPGNGLRSGIRSVAATNICDRRASQKEFCLDRIADEGVATSIHVLLSDHERAPTGRHRNRNPLREPRLIHRHPNLDCTGAGHRVEVLAFVRREGIASAKNSHREPLTVCDATGYISSPPVNSAGRQRAAPLA